MTVPAEAALRVAWGLAVGAMLGLCYDFLRPLRRRFNAPADALFVLIALMAWVWFSFRICDGDIRLGGTASVGVGMLLWLGTVSMVIRKLFQGFWMAIFWIFSAFCMPFAKIFQKTLLFIKKVFAYGKKRGYNRRRNLKNPPQTSGGAHDEYTESISQTATEGLD